MNTFFTAAALFGRPYYDDKTEGESIFDTVLWAFGTLGQKN